MGDSHSWKPGTRSGSSPSPAKPAADASRPPVPATTSGDSRGNSAGRIVHDARGNAVWDWMKDTARIAIDSTSRLLKKLEVPELKVEDTQNQELRLESDRDQGGGYNPYGGSAPTSDRTSGRGRPASGSGAGGSDPFGGAGGPAGHDPYGRSSSQSSGSNKNSGGGYDPYGKSVTPKPPRKP
jgi:hypothetical protein